MSDPGPYYPPTGTGYEYGYAPRPRRFRWVPIVLGVILAGAATVLLLILLYPSWFGFAAPAPQYRFPFGGVFVGFFVLIVVFFILRVAFWSSRSSRYVRGQYRSGMPGGMGANRPVQIARMRYARGEITREQYEQILRDLGRSPPPH
jgi:uncharacterized membrane protein